MGGYFKKWKIRYWVFHKQYGLWFYWEVLKRNIKSSKRLEKKTILQWDNNSSDVSSKALEFYEKKMIERIEWPAKPSDLNPIENIWVIVKRELEKESNQASRNYWKYLGYTEKFRSRDY